MSISSSVGNKSPGDDHYEEFLAAVRRHFDKVVTTEGHDGPVPLFTTDSPDLFPLFQGALPPELRQFYNCYACRKFIERYGGIVRVAAEGTTIPILWDAEFSHPPYVNTVRALAATVAKASINGVFLAAEKHWGHAATGPWHHLAVTPPPALVFVPSVVKTAAQAAAEKRQDYQTLLRGLEEFPLAVVRQAYTLLTTDVLYRSEKCIGVARWLLDLHELRHTEKNLRRREHLTWLAVAQAPAGFCQVRSSMIGTLLEDVMAGLPFGQLKVRFDAKMSPLNYQRPVAAPTAGNLARAEKIVTALRTAGALARRFAKLTDLQTLWLPTVPSEPEKAGVFSHLRPGVAPVPATITVPPVAMTWEKFARTVLPTAESIYFLVPAGKQHYAALVTAKNPEAPPILQWDEEKKRNPVSWYFYTGGSLAVRWNLKEGTYHMVSAITLQPSLWHSPEKFTHQGEKVIFVLQGAKDLEYQQSSGFFPEFLKSEYHEIRATLEAYARSAVIEGKDEATACGIGLQKGTPLHYTFRVTTKGGLRVDYLLDRWD